MQLVVYQNGRFVFQEKSNNFLILAIQVPEDSDSRIFFIKKSNQLVFTDTKLFISTLMEEVEEVDLERVESQYPETHTNLQLLIVSAYHVSVLS